MYNLHTQALYNEIYTNVDSKEIERSIQRAYKKFYLRPKYWLQTALRIRTWNDIKRFLLAGTNIIDFFY